LVSFSDDSITYISFNSGHGALSNHFGLGVEQVLEFEVVTPTGEILIANDNSNTDLFWALRGGGGSTFGIVIKVTYKAYPTLPAAMIMLLMTPNSLNETSQDNFYKAMAYYIAKQPEFVDFGLSGHPAILKYFYNGVLIAPGKTSQELEQFWIPISKRLEEMGAYILHWVIGDDVMNFARLFGFGGGLAASIFTEPSNLPLTVGSRVLARKALSESNLTVIYRMVKSVLEDGSASLQPYPVMPGIQHLKRPWNFALNPAWQTGVLHLITTTYKGIGTGNYSITELRSKAKNTVRDDLLQKFKMINEKLVPAMEPLSENHASYLNEVYKSSEVRKTTEVR
jgi:hypothetical protein